MAAYAARLQKIWGEVFIKNKAVFAFASSIMNVIYPAAFFLLLL